MPHIIRGAVVCVFVRHVKTGSIEYTHHGFADDVWHPEKAALLLSPAVARPPSPG